MRSEKWLGLALWSLALGSGHAQEGQPVFGVENEMSGKVDYDEVALDLAKRLTGPQHDALDAATKLGNLGKRAVPLCADLMEKSKDTQVRYYAILALSRVRHKSAAQALLPLVSNEKEERSLREMAIGSVSAEGIDEGIAPLQKVAKDDPDGALRFKALLALSVMPTAWAPSEALFVKGLTDERDDIRQLAAKVCHQVAAVKIYYRSGEPALLKLAEEDSVIPVRCNAIAALARMQSRMGVNTFVKLLTDPQTPAPVAQQALRGMQLVTGVSLRDAAATQAWWEKFGKDRYKDAKPLLLDAEVLKQIEAEQAQREGEAKNKSEEPPAEVQPKRPVLKAIPDDAPSDKPFTGATMGE